MPYIDTKHLFKCETCRRYRGGKCLAWCENRECYSPNTAKIPTADVVPRSEVEELKKAYANYEETTGLKQAKQEVAREIFEEIEKLLYIGIVEHVNCIDAYVKKGYVELKKKYVTDTNDGHKVSSGDICVVCGESVPEGRQVCGMCETGQEFLKKRKE